MLTFHSVKNGGSIGCNHGVTDMKNLRKLRRDAGLTQHGLAKLTDISRVKICHAELGMATLTPNEIASIRKVLIDVSQKKSARVLRELDPGE
jgi:predicted transcriptional regulator